MKDEVIIQEYSERLIQGYECSEEERNFLKSYATINDRKPWEKRFYFDELKTGLRIRTESYVGIIELEKIRIIIQPKFDKTFTSVIDMALFANGRPHFTEIDTKGSMGRNDLFTLLIGRFLHETEILLSRGLKKDYVTERDNLKQVRGRILLRENAQKNFNLPINIYCEFDELTHNVLENQLVMTVLSLLKNVQIEESLKQRVHKMTIQFSNLTESYRGNEWPKVSYNRLNEPYRMAHSLGKLIFEKLFLQNYMSSEANYFAFLIDMNELFEKFVGKILKTYLPTSFTVLDGKRITNAILLDGKRYRDIIPDIVVKDEKHERTFVIDTKYKAYDFKRVSTDDVFQLAFYAQYFQQEEFYEASIIYPIFSGVESTTTRTINLNKFANNSGQLYLKSVSIIELLDAVKKRNRTYLNEVALDLVFGGREPVTI